ncbi:hypothetical protein AXG93_4080s1150 [Marchantia polymorpha subsp. ruderalis]|uniref:Mre11 DNA-binding domain-containing protein n=1 Tax=Marchantia polymorpha subsp. ruderalis TaxID=1480154 RepID=A0A176VWV9_MARPO|nr:hypothetical protein AXG93_4080s1150 [Marchantia polymorpha subsp. ruderalis]
MEKDEVRGLDSFNAFDEVCAIAAEKEVDFLLLGGDLFHENKPSRTTLVRTIDILRRYCLNKRPVKFKVVSDQAVNFPGRFGHVNFEDPYFDVGLPVFSIHGNHDDPAGVDNLSAVDILSSCNLVNYFGKVVLGGQGVGQITLNPILIRKGSTNVALYGLGNIRDERLNRMFQTPHAVQWVRPEAEEDCAVSDWFNIFVIHQNRVKSNPKNAINEHYLARFLDFVIWGHEHECLVDPQEVPGMGFHVTQPGSSVATSLIEGEAAPKHVLLLEVKGNQYRPTKIPLHSVRPFLFKDISFKDEPDLDANDQNAVLEFLGQQVQDLISQVQKKPDKSPESQVPLVRLRVDYTGFTTINPQRFGQKFVGKVANPNDILLFTKASKARRAKQEEGEEDEALGPEELNQQNIEALVAECNLKMEILPVTELGEALHAFVNKDDKQAFHLCVQHNLDETRNKLAKEDADEMKEEKDVIEKVTMHMQAGFFSFNPILEELKVLRQEFKQREAEAISKRGAGPSGLSTQLDQTNQGGSKYKAKVEPKSSGLQDFSDDEEVIGLVPSRGKQPLKTTGRGRGSTRKSVEPSGRGTAARGRGSRGGKLKQTTLADMMGGGSTQVRSSTRIGASSGSASAVVQILDSDEEEAVPAASDDEDDPDEVPEEEGSDSDPGQTPARGRKRALPRGRGRGAKTQEPRAKRGRKSSQLSSTPSHTNYIEDDLEDDDDDKPAPRGRGGTSTTAVK